MRIRLHKATSNKVKARMKNRARIRKKISGTAERPRICVFRSRKYIYAQLMDDVTGTVICSASSKGEKGAGNMEAAKKVGLDLGAQAKKKKIEKASFDRSGYIYHGRVKAVADGYRESGLTL